MCVCVIGKFVGGASWAGDPYPLRLHLQFLCSAARKEAVHSVSTRSVSLSLPVSAPGETSCDGCMHGWVGGGWCMMLVFIDIWLVIIVTQAYILE